eukprot:TRINITY_DN1120_c7_g1_i1.p1 TRINITY_DN1120_c7_g1~~TRINITY_DN1120_c7_g1_i1.p1  ORF type:complete len:106 (+),score=32.29 TRINITY_DN1120_c7_g1_i1:82-399(+)
MASTDVVSKYLELRTNKKNKEIVALLAEDFVLEHISDGTIKGKSAMAKYLDSHPPPSGKWDAPKKIDEKKVKVTGTVKKLMMNWSVTGEFKFNSEGQIRKIKMYR